MRKACWIVCALCAVFMAGLSSAAPSAGSPVSTYSIVARDSVTGEIGVAVQSHWFSVGSVVPWAEAGVGAVATQSIAEISYGPLGLDLMRAGKSAEQALEALLHADDHPEWRQVAMVDASGNVAVHTGHRCIAEAGHRTGPQYSVQANLMEKNTVWDAMAEAYEKADGDLADRMLAALEAAQGEGGDIRGMQSAAIVIVKPVSSGNPYMDRVIDLRVEDDPDPVGELKRLVSLAKAYNLMNTGDAYIAEGDVGAAMEAYASAMLLAPGVPELRFWAAVTMFTEGNKKRALEYFEDVFAMEKRWTEVVKRLPAAGLLPADEASIEEILNVAGKAR